MKANSLVRIVIYSLVIVLLLGILMAGIGWDLFAVRRIAQTESADVTVPADSQETMVSSPEDIRSIQID